MTARSAQSAPGNVGTADSDQTRESIQAKQRELESRMIAYDNSIRSVLQQRDIIDKDD
jgi:hypothetical protein